jgi:hypothetical protein
VDKIKLPSRRDVASSAVRMSTASVTLSASEAKVITQVADVS